MSLTAGMETLCKNIAIAKPERHRFVRECRTTTRELLRNYHSQRRQTAQELRKRLHEFCAHLENQCKEMLHKFEAAREKTFREFIAPLRKDIQGMHEVFARFAAGHFEEHFTQPTKKTTKKKK